MPIRHDAPALGVNVTTYRAAGRNDLLRDVLSRLDLDILGCREIPRLRPTLNPPYLIDAKEGRYFLKLKRPVASRAHAQLRAFLGNPGFSWETTVLEALQRIEFDIFRFPRLVQTDGADYALFEYVPRSSAQKLSGDYTQLFARALVEFQSAELRLDQQARNRLWIACALTPSAKMLRRTLPRLFGRYGLATAKRYAQIARQCERSQGRIRKQWMLHNDLHHDNVFIGADGQLYFTDFENAAPERKWLLTDIVNFAVGTSEPVIDFELIQRYLLELRCSPFSGYQLKISGQLRFALMESTAQHVLRRAPLESVRKAYEKLLFDVLLDDVSFEEWLDQEFGESI